MKPKNIANVLMNFYKGVCKKAKISIDNEFITSSDMALLLKLVDNEFLTMKEFKNIINRRLLGEKH